MIHLVFCPVLLLTDCVYTVRLAFAAGPVLKLTGVYGGINMAFSDFFYYGDRDV